MIHWKKQNPKLFVVDILGLRDNVKAKVTLASALEMFRKSQIDSPDRHNIKHYEKKILKVLNGKMLIETITVKDFARVFDSVGDTNDSMGYRLRSAAINAIRFALTGELPQKKEAVAQSTNGAGDDIGAMEIQIGNFADMAMLIPRYVIKGRFPLIKAQVQDAIAALEPNQSALFTPTRKKIDEKEGASIEREIDNWLAKNGLAFTLRYNPIRKVFVLASINNFESLKKPKKAVK